MYIELSLENGRTHRGETTREKIRQNLGMKISVHLYRKLPWGHTTTVVNAIFGDSYEIAYVRTLVVNFFMGRRDSSVVVASSGSKGECVNEKALLWAIYTQPHPPILHIISYISLGISVYLSLSLTLILSTPFLSISLFLTFF